MTPSEQRGNAADSSRPTTLTLFTPSAVNRREQIRLLGLIDQLYKLVSLLSAVRRQCYGAPQRLTNRDEASALHQVHERRDETRRPAPTARVLGAGLMSGGGRRALTHSLVPTSSPTLK